MKGAARLWARTRWRRQWPTLALAWLVLALTGALALGAATGARRAVSAFDRLREQTHAAELTVEDIDLEAIGDGADYEEVVSRVLPLIDAVGATYERQYFIFPVGFELYPTFDFYPIVQQQILDHPANVPVVVAGRMPLPGESNEVALSQQLADLFGVDVGDSIAFESVSLDWMLRSFSSPDPGPKDGPTLQFAIVGVVVSPLDFTAPAGAMYLTTAFTETYGGQVGSFPPGTEIFLDDPTRAAELIRAGSLKSGDEVLDAAVAITTSRWGDQQQVSDGLRVAAAALWIFAGAVAVAGLATAALILRRLARSMSVDIEVLSALGVGRLDRAAFGALLLSPVIALSAAATFVGALIVAPLTRLGLADQVEPDRGVFFDWPVLVIGTVVLALATLVGTVPPLRRRHSPVVRFRSSGHRSDAGGGGHLGLSIDRPIAFRLGIREALTSRGSGRTAVVTTACLLATVVASLVVGESLSRLPTRPDLWGGGSDVVIDFGEREGGEPNIAYDQALRALATDGRTAALTGTATFFPEIDGNGLTGFALDTRRGDPVVTIVAGRSARNPDEIVMGRATMNRHAVHLGDKVVLTVAGQSETFKLVGQAVFPIGDNPFDDALAVTSAGAARFVEVDSESGTNQILLTWADGVDGSQARQDLLQGGYRVLDRPRLPPTVTNLLQVDQVPNLLTIFFGALGVASLSYMLGVWSRARGRQFAVLATLGLRPHDLVATRRWHAVTIALAAALIAVPVGVVAGRVVWGAIADSAGVAVSHAAPVGAIAGATAATFLTAIVIALTLSRSSRRQTLAVALRAA